jgi:hypothetical protein
MKRTAAVCALALGVVACGDGNPFNSDGDPPVVVPAVPVTTFLDGSSDLTANDIVFDAATDTLIINNIPFDDPQNIYERVTTEAFVGSGFDAYQSAPAPGSAELQYFAIFRRSDSGQSQVATTTSAEYIGFGFGGGGAERLGVNPTLPRTGVYTYNGEYGAVRTVLNGVGSGDRVEYVTGNAQLAADFGDFDDIGAVNGIVSNRILYDDTGAQIGTVAGFISLANGEIDFDNGTIQSSTAVELDGTGMQVATGNWQGLFAGPNGEEIAGVLFVDGASIREVGGIVATTP